MVTGWASVNGVWYYLGTAAYVAADPYGNATNGVPVRKEGAMITGWFCDPDTGLWYWLDENGAMAVTKYPDNFRVFSCLFPGKLYNEIKEATV